MTRWIVTLVGAPAIGEDALDLVSAAIGAGPPDWLAPGHACDLVADAPPDRDRLAALAPGIDIAIQPAGAGRRKRLLIADMDSTIVTAETLDELAAAAGIGARVAAITRAAMLGEIDFVGALRERVALLEGLDLAVLAHVRAEVALTPGARALVATMRRHGAYAALVSGGFTAFAEPVAATCGFDEFHANRLELAEDRLTGRVVPPIVDRDTKLEVLTRLCRSAEIGPFDAAAVGDGANDLAMIQAAGMGVAYHGKPAVRQGARFRIDHGDLTAMLYFQGYRLEEFVGG